MGAVRPGDLVAGKFQIERVLGEGGMGYVVAARHLQLGQTVALKFIREDVLTSEYKARFLREARNTVRLKSSHVSRVLDVGTLEGGSPYMVMEYLDGTDLSAMLHQRGAISAAEACDYVIQACEAIAEAHANLIVHRDLKPANLFLSRGPDGEPFVKVLDFGVSKVLELDTDETMPGGSAFDESVVTKATDLLGSPSYMAPEQVMSARDADASSDVWSLGVILFRMIAGAPPFGGANLGEVVQKIIHGPVPNLRDVRPDLPAGLELVVLRCLDRERGRRPDAVELARLLAPYAGPSARPSLERMAILGPALVSAPITSPSLAPAAPRPPSAPEAPVAAASPGRPRSAAVVLAALVVAAVLALLIVVGVKVYRTRATTTQRAPSAAPSSSSSSPSSPAASPSSAPAPAPAPKPEPAPAEAPPDLELAAEPPSPAPSASASPRPRGTTRPKRPASPKSDIPSSRE